MNAAYLAAWICFVASGMHASFSLPKVLNGKAATIDQLSFTSASEFG